ncbi:MAG: hypothetical protein M3Z09_08780 [Acidobacteriota bacterium]|nr:hypothetical protein [Acidobacteriota bacterium]
MADFRKYAVTVAGLACMLGVTGTASAQFVGFTCNATATPFDMRAEGITEQAGDIVLSCTGGTATPLGSQIPQVNITVSLNTNITSRLLGGSSNLTDAVLLLNEPVPGNQSFCPASGSTAVNQCVEYGFGTGGGQGTQTYNPFPAGGIPAGVPNTGRYNGVQGTLVGPSQITFFGVPIDPPGPSTSGGTVPTLTVRVTNIRANASSLGGPALGSFATSSVFETISTSAGFQINNNVQTVGSVRRGLIQGTVANSSLTGGGSGTIFANSSSSPGTFQQCNSRSFSSTGAPIAETVNFSEGFATATKLRVPNNFPAGASLATPGAQLNSESQFVPSGTQGYAGGSSIGTADQATRIRLTFNNLQSGVTIFVPTSLSSNQVAGGVPTETLTLTSSEGGAFSAVSNSTNTNIPANFAALTATGTSAVAIYEVTNQSITSPSTIESFSAPILVTFTASPSTSSPGLGMTTVNVDFAPTSTVVTASSGPIPRFVPSSTAANGFQITPCSTVLLFPFLSNLAGFDTGLAISNTSTDPFGTAAQSGLCTLNFYGTNQTAAFTTPTVTSALPYTNLVSTLAPGFQGYMIAQCRFQYAHGFAFITDGFGGPGRGLSQGYLALVIPDPGASSGSRSPSNAGTAASGSGEGLTN